MGCCARNIERLTRIPKLRTDVLSRFEVISTTLPAAKSHFLHWAKHSLLGTFKPAVG